MDRVRDSLVLAQGAEQPDEARVRAALLHMLEELQRDRDLVQRARRHWVDTFDSVRDPMMVHDEEHRVVRCNRAYAALAGMDIRELIGKPYWQMFPKLGGPLPGCRHIAAGPEATVEEEFCLPSGETYLSKSFPLSEDGKTVHFLHIMQDITERNRIREAVERSERRYRALAANSSDLVVVLDAQGTIAYVSPSVRQIVGYDVDEVLGKPYFDFVHPDDLAAARTRFPEIVAKPGPVAQMEFRYLHKNGSWVTLESIARNALGDPLVGGIVVNARDVTQRNAATRNIANLSRLYATLSGVNSAIVHSRTAADLFEEICRIAVERGQFRIAWVSRYNKATEALTVIAQRGIPESELAQLMGTASNLADGAGASSMSIREGVVVHIKDLASQTRPSVWDALAIKWGARSCAAVPIRRNGEIIGALKLFVGETDLFDPQELDLLREMGQDIEFALNGFERDTQREKAQHELRDSEERFRAMFEQAGVGILEVSLAGKFTRVNPAFCSMLGYPAAELLGRGFQDVTHPEDQTKSAALAEALAGPHATVVRQGIEKRYIRKDGTTIWGDVSVAVVRDERGNPLHFVTVVQDITKRKRVQEKLRESHALLEATERIAGIGGFRWDVGNDAVTWSDEIYRIFGRDPRAWKPTLAAFIAAVHPDDRPCVQDAIAAAVARTRPFDCEFRIVRPDGSERHIRSRAELALDAKAKPLRLTGTSHDITERRLAEETQRFTNAVLAAQQDLSLDGILVVDKDQKIVSFNQRFVEMWGIPDEVIALRSDEAALRSVLDNFESPDEFLDGVKRIYAQKDLKLHDELRLKGGRTFERYSSPMVSADGKYYGRAFYFRDITERKRAEETLRAALVATIEAMAATVEARDPYTAGHQHRVADLAAAIAREMGLAPDAVEGVRFGALIHDLGKVQVPAELLSKPTRLTKIELELIRTHPQSGYDIVKGIKFPWPVADMVHQHHERLDGSGYPQGLKGDAITLEARILTVADVVEAMSSHRPYRPGLGIDVALKEIEEKSGKWYDPQAVDACLRLFREDGFVLGKHSEGVTP